MFILTLTLILSINNTETFNSPNANPYNNANRHSQNKRNPGVKPNPKPQRNSDLNPNPKPNLDPKPSANHNLTHRPPPTLPPTLSLTPNRKETLTLNTNSYSKPMTNVYPNPNSNP